MEHLVREKCNGFVCQYYFHDIYWLAVCQCFPLGLKLYASICYAIICIESLNHWQHRFWSMLLHTLVQSGLYLQIFWILSDFQWFALVLNRLWHVRNVSKFFCLFGQEDLIYTDTEPGFWMSWQIVQIVKWFLDEENHPSFSPFRVLRVKNRFKLSSNQVIQSYNTICWTQASW